MIYKIKPTTKPRMTRSDKWKQRPSVMKYRSFKDKVREHKIKLPECNYWTIFHIPMPDSWSKRKKAEYEGLPMRQTPDKDNLEKALLDSLFKDDSHIWDGRVSKFWSYEGSIEVLTSQCNERKKHYQKLVDKYEMQTMQ